MTMTVTDWHCRCGTFNKASWTVCPGCGVSRETLTAPSPQQLAQAHQVRSQATRRATSNVLHGIFGACVVLALLAGLAFGGLKGWQYADQRWFDSSPAAEKKVPAGVPTTKAKPDDKYAALAARTLGMPAGAKPFYDPDFPRSGRIPVSAFFKKKQELAAARSLGVKAIYARAWQQPSRRTIVVTMQLRDSTGPALMLQGARQAARKPGERRFSAGMAGGIGSTGKDPTNPGYLTVITMARGSRLAFVFVSTPRPATRSVVSAARKLGRQQYALL